MRWQEVEVSIEVVEVAGEVEMEVGNEVEIEPLRADTKLATGGKQADNQIQIDWRKSG